LKNSLREKFDIALSNFYFENVGACALDDGRLDMRFSDVFSLEYKDIPRCAEPKIARLSTHSRTRPREICRLGA
jgi:hypothetical protein